MTQSQPASPRRYCGAFGPPTHLAKAITLTGRGLLRGGHETRYDNGRSRMPVNSVPSWFGFLRIEADLAITFIDVARIHLSPENSARSLGNARKALAEIQRCLMKPTTYSGLTEDDRLFLERRCTEIKSALRAFVPAKRP